MDKDRKLRYPSRMGYGERAERSGGREEGAKRRAKSHLEEKEKEEKGKKENRTGRIGFLQVLSTQKAQENTEGNGTGKFGVSVKS